MPATCHRSPRAVSSGAAKNFEMARGNTASLVEALSQVQFVVFNKTPHRLLPRSRVGFGGDAVFLVETQCYCSKLLFKKRSRSFLPQRCESIRRNRWSSRRTGPVRCPPRELVRPFRICRGSQPIALDRIDAGRCLTFKLRKDPARRFLCTPAGL